jgi:hypothetical protein
LREEFFERKRGSHDLEGKELENAVVVRIWLICGDVTGQIGLKTSAPPYFTRSDEENTLTLIGAGAA